MRGILQRDYSIPEKRVAITILDCPLSELKCSKEEFNDIIKPTKAEPLETIEHFYEPEGYSVAAIVSENQKNFESRKKLESRVQTLTASCKKSAVSLHIYPDLMMVTGDIYLCYDTRPLLAVIPLLDKFKGNKGDILYHTSYFSNINFDVLDFKKVISFLDKRGYSHLINIDSKRGDGNINDFSNTYLKGLIFKKQK